MGIPAWRLRSNSAADRAVDWTALQQLAWPAIIVGATLASAWVVYFDTAGLARAVITLGFLVICPGMAYVRLLRLSNAIHRVALAVALSLALDLLVSTVVLYVGAWSPLMILGILIELSLVGAIAQVWLWHRRHY
jgi:hypothetical protein